MTTGVREHSGKLSPRSGYGTVPGEEFPPAVYRSVILAFGSTYLAAWLMFADSAEMGLVIVISTVLLGVILGLPVIITKTASARTRDHHIELDRFPPSRFETATGTLSRAEAWLQVLIIPLALVLAALAIGAVFVVVT